MTIQEKTLLHPPRSLPVSPSASPTSSPPNQSPPIAPHPPSPSSLLENEEPEYQQLLDALENSIIADQEQQEKGSFPIGSESPS